MFICLEFEKELYQLKKCIKNIIKICIYIKSKFVPVWVLGCMHTENTTLK